MEYQQTPPPAPPQYDIPVRPKTWLVESILVTILCCLPFGIVGIVYASKVNSLYDQTKYEESKRASNTAKRWIIAGLLIGVVYLVFIVIMTMTGMLSELDIPGANGLTF